MHEKSAERTVAPERQSAQGCVRKLCDTLHALCVTYGVHMLVARNAERWTLPCALKYANNSVRYWCPRHRTASARTER